MAWNKAEISRFAAVLGSLFLFFCCRIAAGGGDSLREILSAGFKLK